MPITGPSSYLVTLPLFLNHWEDVNAAGAPLVLDREACGQPADVDVAQLQVMADDLTTQRGVLEGVLLDATLASAELLQHRTWLHAQAVAFNQSVRADHGTSIYARALEPAPQLSEAREKFLKPLRLIAALWLKVNAFRAALATPKPPLTLPGGITQADFAARLEVGRVAFNSAEEREQQATLERGIRNELQDLIYPILKVYRLKVEATYAAGSAIMATLPALTDDGSGTPQPGTLTGSFNAATGAATLTGTPSSSGTVVRHQIRASLGPEPDAEDEALKAEFTPGQPITLTTSYGFSAPGALVHFRLVAITADGHEKGSDWLTLQRPL
jgi:hypothetical protein